MGKRNQLECRRPDVNPDIFFSTSVRKIEQAKALCAMCPAQHACLLASFARPGEMGTWGGMTEDERADLVDAVHLADDGGVIEPGHEHNTEHGRSTDTQPPPDPSTPAPVQGEPWQVLGVPDLSEDDLETVRRALTVVAA